MNTNKPNSDSKDLSNKRNSGFAGLLSNSNSSFNFTKQKENDDALNLVKSFSFNNENINNINSRGCQIHSFSQLGKVVENENGLKRNECLPVLSERKEYDDNEDDNYNDYDNHQECSQDNKNNTSTNKTEYTSKKSQLDVLINQLKEHYYIDEFFIDPDKKFISLLKKLINFFEEDSLLQQVQQNEALYFTFKKKYEDAIEFIKSIKDIPSLIIKNQSSPFLDRSKKRLYPQSSTVSNRKFIFYEGNTKPAADFSFGLTSNVKSTGEVVFSEVVNANENEGDINKIIQIYKKDYDRLKEDYITIVNEKKILEDQVMTQENLRFELKSLSDENYNLKTSSAEMKERIERNKYEIQDYQRRIKLLENDYQRMKENYNLVKNAVGYAEEEKILFKNKYNDQVSKMKALERENLKLKKKNVSLNDDLKKLEERLDVEVEEKAMLEDRIEELKEEIEIKEKDYDVAKVLSEGEVEVIDDMYNIDKVIIKMRIGFGEEEKNIELDNIKYTPISKGSKLKTEIPNLRLDLIKPINMKKSHSKLKNWSFSNRGNMSINGQGNIVNANESTLRLNTDNSIIAEEKGVSLHILNSNSKSNHDNIKEDDERLNINTLLTCESNENSRTMKKIETIQSSDKKDKQKSLDFQSAIINTNLKTRFIVSHKEKGGLRRMLSFVEDDFGSIAQKKKELFDKQSRCDYNENEDEGKEMKVLTYRERDRFDNSKLMLEKSQCVSMMNKEKERVSKWREVLNYMDESMMFVPFSCVNRLDETMLKVNMMNRTMIENQTIDDEGREDMNGNSYIREERVYKNKECKYIYYII